MKKLQSLKGSTVLSKDEQKSIYGSSGSMECVPAAHICHHEYLPCCEGLICIPTENGDRCLNPDWD
ncbi:hypothetical protein SAMN02927921_00466 [Sinomicrobium oceani]|uniref:Uncharacterized protein n=1 Tax=Sinomicrobium oceani TaxID=1150368 RepID=A0A1K1M850_9FLAO|nr:hypothetical protein SAMN02927921_00466 [Sinomicrobium oceani]